MEKIKKERIIQEFYYQSVDGLEFRDSNECCKWEESAKGAARAAVMALNNQIISWENVPGGCEYRTYRVFCPKNQEEVFILNRYSNLCGYPPELTEPNKHYVFEVECDDEQVFYACGTIESYIENFNKYLN